MRAPRRSRLEHLCRGALLLFLSGHCLGSAPAPFSCPAGAKLEKRPHSSEPTQIELCRDPATDLREGPYREIGKNGLVLTEGHYRADKLDGELRLYDEQGRLTHVARFSNGNQLEMRVMRLGMEGVARMLNAKAHKNGQNWQMAVRDEHTMEYILNMGTKSEQFTPDAEVMRGRLVADGRICELFGKIANMQSVIARYVDGGGKDLLVVPVRRSDCGK